MSKRVFDLLVAGLLLVLVSPILVLAALALKLQRRTPVLNLSPRVGWGGRPFRLIRFRTMGDAAGAPDPELRLTPVGRIIRDLSIDDMPGLINVLWGDMSMIGPRPMEPERVDLADPVWRRILSVRPGVVSPAILALASTYNASDMATRQRLELAYIERQTVWSDVRLVGAAIRGYWASRGNVKARGRPTVSSG